MKILFITARRIGDAIISTGILNTLAEKYPKAQVTIACGPLVTDIFQDYPNLHALIPLNRRKFSLHWYDLWSKTVLNMWDLVIDLRGSAFSYIVPTKNRSVWRSQPSDKNRVEQLSQMMGYLKPAAPKLWVNQDIQDSADDSLRSYKGPFIGLGPAANWRGKEWTYEGYTQLISALKQSDQYKDLPVMVFSAPDEAERLTPLIKNLEALVDVVDLRGKLSLRELPAYMSKCRVYVGSDSGLMHMAAALRVPTVGLFGPSKDHHYAPWGSHCRVVRTKESYDELIQHHHKQESLLTSISVQDVLKAIESLALTGENQ